MLGIETTNWITIYKSTPGRRAFACGDIETQARANYAEVAALATKVRLHDEAVVDLQQKWLATREDAAGAEANAETIAADRVTDRWVGSTVRTLKELATLGNERGQAANRILRKDFPAGADAITSAPFADANQTLKAILADLTGPSAEDVATVGIGDHVVELAKAHAAFDAAMRKQNGARIVTYDEVRAADRKGQALFSDLIIAILFQTTAPERRADRAALLRPVDVQNEALRELHRSRRRVTDVDPKTGVAVDDGAADTDAPAAPGDTNQPA